MGGARIPRDGAALRVRARAIDDPPCPHPPAALARQKGTTEAAMGINTESDIAANLQIGPTDAGMVRIYVE
ncbi:MAG: hypothetical protein KDE00_15000, partial [Rhodobacteraceae bacterium]|nr:hypothetical protein [Paracoccaceae bacterium]